MKSDVRRGDGRKMIFAALALAWAPSANVQEQPPQSEQEVALPPLPYISELSRSGYFPAMFDRPVKAKADLVSLFSTDDYPLESSRNGEEGTVAVVLRVSKEGRLSDCIVEYSSGFPALDTQTCRIFWQRAQFEPARDSSGRPVESAWRQRIRWELPEPDPIPSKAWSIQISLEFVKEGGVVGCEVRTGGAMKSNPDQCRFFRSMTGDALAQLRADAGYERQKFIMESNFVPGHSVPAAAPPNGFRLAMRQVARLTIDASGMPMKCDVIETVGPKPPVDGCFELLDDRYEAPGIKVGAIETTIARNLYVTE